MYFYTNFKYSKIHTKNYKILILIIIANLLLIYKLFISIKNDNIFCKIKKDNNLTENSIKINTYNIFMNNILDFFSSNIFLLNKTNNNNKESNTFFFKPEYPKKPYKYIKFQKKNISLRLTNDKETQPTFFSGFPDEFRRTQLKKLGFNFSSLMKINNLYLVPNYINRTFIEEIKKYIIDKSQKINSYLNCEEYTSKSLLYSNYKIFEDKYPKDYKYMLETYSYPEDKEKIQKKFQNYIYKNESDLWLIKPKNLWCGINISILTNFSNININNYILTKFLYNPLLIKGYKFDLRIHGLITGVKPLKLYLYNEGLVRIASEKYNFSKSTLNNKYAILTNLYLNIKNKKKFIYPQNLPNLEESNLWNIETFQNYCERNNINFSKIFSEIGDIFIKAILSVREKLIKFIEKNNFYYSNFYHLIGFDIIIDENLKPYLLELNNICGLRNDNDAEKYFTHNLIVDTLNILGICPKNLTFINRKKNKRILFGESIEESLKELDRPRGGYKLIFPLKKSVESYKKLFGKNLPKEDKELWKYLKE